eukprot:2555203-Rhodomonas_salina.1
MNTDSEPETLRLKARAATNSLSRTGPGGSPETNSAVNGERFSGCAMMTGKSLAQLGSREPIRASVTCPDVGLGSA